MKGGDASTEWQLLWSFGKLFLVPELRPFPSARLYLGTAALSPGCFELIVCPQPQPDLAVLQELLMAHAGICPFGSRKGRIAKMQSESLCDSGMLQSQSVWNS